MSNDDLELTRFVENLQTRRIGPMVSYRSNGVSAYGAWEGKHGQNERQRDGHCHRSNAKQSSWSSEQMAQSHFAFRAAGRTIGRRKLPARTLDHILGDGEQDGDACRPANRTRYAQLWYQPQQERERDRQDQQRFEKSHGLAKSSRYARGGVPRMAS